MRNITLLDATLREAAGSPLGFKDKVDIAKQADLLRLSLLETAPLLQGASDVLFLHTIAPLLKHTALSVPVDPNPAAITAAWDALRGAPRAQLNIRVPVSTVQMEYLWHKKAPAMLEMLAKAAEAANAISATYEFSLMDATRAEPDVLDAALRAAANTRAVAITLCDNAGILLPEEFAAFVTHAKTLLPETLELGVECSDELGLGAACAVQCLQAGATRIRTAVTTRPTLPPTAALVHILRQKADSLTVATPLDYTLAEQVPETIASIVGIEGADDARGSVSTEAAPSVALRATASDDEIAAAIAALGYSLSADDLQHVYREFRRIAERKDAILPRDLDAIVATVARQVPETYALESFVITCGNTITSMANVTLLSEGKTLSDSAVGNGPIDAAFHSIENIVGHHFELDDFQIQTVTEGRAAMGNAIVKLRACDGRLFSGKGVSTDIVGASIRAYVDALNKICHAEKED